MRYSVHVGINQRSTFGKERRQHWSQRRQQVFIVTNPNEGNNCVGCPSDEPQSDDTEHDYGQFEFLFGLVFVWLDLIRRYYYVHYMRIAVGDGDKRNAPRTDKVAEHEDARVHVVSQVVKTAAGEESLGHITAEDA